MNPWTIIGLLASGYLAYLGQPQIIQMFMGMKNPEDNKKGAFISGATAFFLLFGGLLALMGARILTNNPDDQETNFLLLMMTHLPGWLVGIVCAGIAAGSTTYLTVRAIRESEGAALISRDEEALEMQKLLAQTEGDYSCNIRTGFL